MSTDYIQLNGLKYYAVEEYAKSHDQAESRTALSSGQLHVVRGRIHPMWAFQVFAPAATTDVGWGTLDDIEDLFLQSQLGDDLFVFIDFDEVEHTVQLLGQFQPTTWGVHITGTDALFLVRLDLYDRSTYMLDLHLPETSGFTLLLVM